MPEAVIIDAARTPMGRYGGILKDIRPDDLAAHVIAKLIARNGIDKATIEDVILGCTNQAGEDCRNVGRNASLLAGIPDSVPGVTVNRLCGSGLEAVNQAGSGGGSRGRGLFVAGGVEMMTRAPLVMPKGSVPFARGDVTVYDSVLGWRFPNPRMGELYPLISLGEDRGKQWPRSTPSAASNRTPSASGVIATPCRPGKRGDWTTKSSLWPAPKGAANR